MTNSWLVRTAQLWKIVVAIVALVLAAAFQFVLIRGGVERTTTLWVVLAFLVSAGTALTFLLFAVRCRACGARAVFHVVRSVASTRWLTAVFALDACPRCGDAGGSRKR